jgi:polyisoprenoid-binding protein YceI
MGRGRGPGGRAQAILAAALLPWAGARAEPVAWSADPARSRLQVHVLKKGLLSGLAHDHHFLATTWRVSARFDPGGGGQVHAEAVVRAASLEDQQPALSAADRKKVDQQAGQTLDVAHFPEIRFTTDGPLPPAAGGEAGVLEGNLAGTLALHGRERPLALPVRATREGAGWRVQGRVRFKQSDFGVEPFSGFLGTIAVHDEVEVEVDLVLSPAG